LTEAEQTGRRHRGGSVWLARTAAGLVMVFLVCFAVGFARFAAMIETAEPPLVHHADGIVALTGGADRVSDAMTLLLEGHADRLLITGVNPATTRKDLARGMPAARSAVECCVDLGYRAENTRGNASETADWVRAHDIHSLVIVTSNYHMPRALAEMAYRLPGVDLQAYPVVSDRARSDAWWADTQRFRLVFGEYVKYVVTRTRQTLLSPREANGDLRVAKDAR
jgi:uncharacterized SAM-binding protein YcdF (DUF218 family)